ncbi:MULTISPECIES: plasma-membrane proton-efflux P-type ATPase [Methylosinus]|uniref:Plasma-membrane proton-efflux P-type ATPase n=1 Tax=Methylosinus trichosporium (strain ATCC 35070 / NCIMB 11131 / UNIQEM 75 / OB3b) TaxID=595536 RepID=A0A2D2CW55_METT3|nr:MULTISPECIES: plasma-membrane proton-efflux P-type ATPase [Methylosinus]ATQ67018.1 plasma-membrane proton-efflux P-type ATPase [Methylosinus trichosporium OB3b]OBS54508.1 plasma-membrane proton-efflux P-type ATPase [Methylosinus sp. 3S-1]
MLSPNRPPRQDVNHRQIRGPELEKMPIDELLTTLGVEAAEGLSAAEARKRLAIFGPNALTEKRVSLLRKLMRYFAGPMAYMIEAAAIVSAIIGHWGDFSIIIALLLFNAALEAWQDRKASNALAALKKGLAPEATLLREGAWRTAPASGLVPGDIVKIRLGVVVPADIRLVGGDYVSIDQAALTGESLPVAKKGGDLAYSGSIVKQGEMTGVVIATGARTFFGRTASLVEGAGAVSHAQKAMFEIGDFLMVIAVALALIMVIVRVYRDLVVVDDWGLSDALSILQFVLVLMVASIPVAMPAVFSITMALGALALSKQKAIVSKLSAIEEMAGVDVLCSDKTGTLTKNQLSVSEPILVQGQDAQDCILAAALASRAEDRDAIDMAVIDALADKHATNGYRLEKYTPFDPVTKRTEARLVAPDGKTLIVAKGAPQAIVQLASASPHVAAAVAAIVADLAAKGSRALAVARSQDGGRSFDVLGVLPMFDPPRDDSKATIAAARAKGLRVEMVTGDDTAIAKETARQLGLGDNIISAADIFPKDFDPNNLPPDVAEAVERADGFARVFPEHKYAIVKALQKRGHLVAMTGDGVNDAPALKQADCGVAVSGATDAARGAAALILTAPGLSVIDSAIDEARRIFGRIESYTLYRVALTIDIMFVVVLSTIFLDFTPLTTAMIVVLSLLDDGPIMTIAYDNTPVSRTPIRWRMPRLLGVSSVLGMFCVLESFGLLLIGVRALSHPSAQALLGISTPQQLQTMMFLQLVVGGHLLLLVTRTERWFFLPPFPAAKLFFAIVITQILAVALCWFGWLVPAIPLRLIGLVWLYCLAFMFVLGFVRRICERFADGRTTREAKSVEIVHRPLAPHPVAAPVRS